MSKSTAAPVRPTKTRTLVALHSLGEHLTSDVESRVHRAVRSLGFRVPHQVPYHFPLGMVFRGQVETLEATRGRALTKREYLDYLREWIGRISKEMTKTWSGQGYFSFTESSIPYTAACIACDTSKSWTNGTSELAREIMELCYKVVEPETTGIIVCDPRLDVVMQEESGSDGVPRLKRRYRHPGLIQVRSLVLDITKDLPGWQVIASGPAVLEIDEESKLPIMRDSGRVTGYWKDWDVLALEILRCILPEEVEATDEELLGLMNTVR